MEGKERDGDRRGEGMKVEQRKEEINACIEKEKKMDS